MPAKGPVSGMMKYLLLASAGGALGAGARYLVYAEFTRRLGASFPWATLTVNVVGSLLIGVLSALLLERFPDGAGLRVFIFTGILGGFTTFSAYSIEVISMLERGSFGSALTYAGSSVLLSLAACWVGLAGTRALIL